MLNHLAREIHVTNKEKGFWDGELTHDKLAGKLALVHSEVTETLEALRKDKGSEEITKEISDIIVRTLDWYQEVHDAGIVHHSLDEVFQQILDKNKERPHMHGHQWG